MDAFCTKGNNLGTICWQASPNGEFFRQWPPYIAGRPISSSCAWTSLASATPWCYSKELLNSIGYWRNVKWIKHKRELNFRHFVELTTAQNVKNIKSFRVAFYFTVLVPAVYLPSKILGNKRVTTVVKDRFRSRFRVST